MGWEFFLIPLIALGVLILSTVLRGPPDPKTRPRRLVDEPPRRRRPENRPRPVAARFEAPAAPPPSVPVPVEVPVPPALPSLEVKVLRPPAKPAQPRFLRSLTSLLDSPRNAALAVVLREILDRPVSMRRRGRSG